MGSVDYTREFFRPATEIPFCEVSRRLLETFADAVTCLRLLHDEQFRAVIEGDQDSQRFDLLIHAATERKHQAKYAYLAHTEEHGC